jgi:hypothetical protein
MVFGGSIMKCLIIFSTLFFSNFAFATDYEFTWGDEFGSLILLDYDTFLMTGGEGEELSLGGWSIATIEDTNPLIGPNDGGIWNVTVSAYSELTINGGELNDIICDDDSTLNLHGGQILGDLVVEDLTSWIHIFGYGFNNDPFLGSPLTGFWVDATPFSINLVDSTISTYDQIVFHEIPEPATLLLFTLGAITIRRRP